MLHTKKIGITVLVLFLGLSIHVKAAPLTQVTGWVVDDSTGNKIAFAHIFNESKRLGTICDRNGIFSIPASKYDTLVLSALGYLGKLVFIADTSVKLQVNMIQRKYEIEAVSIRSFRDYADFKRQFIALELPESPTDRLRQNLHQISQRIAVEAYTNKRNEDILRNQQIGIMPSISMPLYSKQDKQLRNLAEVLQKEEKQRIVHKKYNRALVAKVTKLENDALTEFIAFCDFSTDLLYYMSEYDILVLIERKFKEFQLLNTLEYPSPPSNLIELYT